MSLKPRPRDMCIIYILLVLNKTLFQIPYLNLFFPICRLGTFCPQIISNTKSVLCLLEIVDLKFPSGYFLKG